MNIKFTVLMQDQITEYKKVLSWDDDAITIEDAMDTWRVASVEAGHALHSNHVVLAFNEEQGKLDDCPF